MENFLIYIAKSALAAGAFYLLYLALFQHQKQFVFNRIYLPVSLALSFIIPLITFTSVRYIHIPAAPVETNSFAYLAEPTMTQPLAPAFEMEWFHYLMGLYALGILGFLCYLILGHFKAFSIIKKSRLQKLFNVNVNVTNKDVHPFSFFDKIVLSDRTLDNPHLGMIVLHEEIHVREKHTLDILFAEILFLLQWFNPFAWLLKDAIKNNLEYKTDHQVVKTIDPQQYQLAMVGLAHKEGIAPFLTALNGSQLKNRIVMMKKKTRNKYALLKQLLVLPLLAVLTMSLANKEVKTEIVQQNTDNTEAFVESQISNLQEISSFDSVKGGYSEENVEYENIQRVNFDTGVTEDITIEKFLVTGKVTDHNGTPLPGTAIIVKGSTTGTLADMAGNYRIETDRSATLIFSMVGFQKKEIEIDGQKKIDVQLEPETGSLNKENQAYFIVEEMPEFPGGSIGLKSYLEENLKYPQIALLNGIQGTVYVSFVINEEGNVVQPKIARSVDPALDKEALRLVSSLPRWKPGKQNGKLVKVNYTVKVEFKLTPEQLSEYRKASRTGKLVAKYVFSVSGKVVDENGEPVKGAAVVIKDKNIGTITDNDGNYKLEMNDENATLIVMMSGYINKEVSVNGDTERNIELERDDKIKDGKRIIDVAAKGENTSEDVEYERKINFDTGEIITIEKSTGKIVEKTAPKGESGILEINEVGGKTVANYKNRTYEHFVKGKITDKEGNPIPNVFVFVLNKTIGTVSDANGNYILGLNDTDVTLAIWANGYKGQEIKVNGENVVNIELVEYAGSKVEISGDQKKDLKPFEKNSVRISDNKEPLYVVDGKPVAGINELDPGDIESVTVLKGAEATALYGTVGGKNGVIQVRTKPGTQYKYKSSPNVSIREGKGLGNKKPLFILDGEKFDGDINDISPGDIFSISVLKDEITKEIYGNGAEDGVVIIYTNSYKISSIQDLRKFIAQKIRYPLVAQERNQTGEVKVNVRVESDGRVTVLSDEDTKDDAIALDEVVVVAYAPKSPKVGETDITSDVLKKEVKRVAYMMPAIDIPELMDKDVIVRVKFDLQ